MLKNMNHYAAAYATTLLVTVKSLSPRGAKTRDLRQRSDWFFFFFFLMHKQNSFSWVTLVTFVDGIHDISRDLEIRLALGLSTVWTQVFLLQSNFCLALQVMCIFFPVSSSLVLILGDWEEPVTTRNLLSLAEVLLMSVIDKWEGKHAAD